MSCIMLLVNHGGKCCGIKTIFGFPPAPKHLTYQLGAVPRSESWTGDTGGRGGEEYGSPAGRFFYDEAPMEAAWKRLDRYLDYVDRRRPKHLVEVTMVGGQYRYWKRTLAKRGFRLVTEFVNCNSGNIVYVLHRVSPVEKKEKK